MSGSVPATDERPMRIIADRYQVLHTLGVGGFSKVKLGYDLRTKQHVALKLIANNALRDETALKQSEREIKALSSIKHRNVIALLDLAWDCDYVKKNGTVTKVTLLVLEFAPGGELFDFLSFTGSFSEQLARTYFLQLVNGIAYFHSLHFVNRDLKPENLLLAKDFSLRIADFGLSNTVRDPLNPQRERLLNTECGTLVYLDPAVNARTGYNGKAADLWSAAVILFTLVAGFPPFQSPTVNDWWMNKLMTDRPHLFWAAHRRSVSFSRSFEIFLTALLQPSPENRIRIEQMSSYEWFRGDTINDTMLEREMKERKDRVDLAKLQAKQERKRAEREEEKNNAANRGDDGDYVYLSHAVSDSATNSDLDPNSELLPSSSPSVTLETLALLHASHPVLKDVHEQLKYHDEELEQKVEPDERPPMRVLRSVDLQDDSEALVALPQLDPAAVPVYDETLVPTVLSLLHSSLPLAELVPSLMQTLRLCGFTIRPQRDPYRCKAELALLSGQLVISVQIYQRPASSASASVHDKWLIAFRRHQGKQAEFFDVFAQLLLALKPITETPSQ